ncbi:Exopolyphosphatase [Pelotomaculum schinkii]|uniref:Exopolyphosphatase n=1 Tax=Pelotomaculum schinkii TaxID=78350 RepID=A0A4Y7RHZ4_9FIRM|nr:Ppx/GppA phosphatase family protein [Pelotomaculum schinkii]TEB08380.1 Exopolyphosphatase [Pelotomaculum schinkii]
MKRVGAIDIGTNSTRLLVAEESDGHLRTVATNLAITRLGEGIGSGELLPPAMARTTDAVAGFFHEAVRLGAETVVAVATSAVRDAANRADFLELVKKKTGLQIRVLSGTEEASYSYLGVVSGLPIEQRSTAVLDVGGGSTELSWMEPQGLNTVSVNMGSVRLTLSGLSPAEVAAAFHPHLNRARQAGAAVLVGVGGTVTTLAAIQQELAIYDPERVHGFSLSILDVTGILERLAGMELAERKKVAGLQPGRADVIVAGVTIVKVVMEGLGVDRLTVSEWDLLHSLILEEVERK